jgi:hypothetical protein
MGGRAQSTTTPEQKIRGKYNAVQWFLHELRVDFDSRGARATARTPGPHRGPRCFHCVAPMWRATWLKASSLRGRKRGSASARRYSLGFRSTSGPQQRQKMSCWKSLALVRFTSPERGTLAARATILMQRLKPGRITPPSYAPNSVTVIGSGTPIKSTAG